MQFFDIALAKREERINTNLVKIQHKMYKQI
jgi:hypothetical protein